MSTGSKRKKDFSWKPLDFDTNLFGFKVAKIEKISRAKTSQELEKIIQKLLSELRTNKIKYATCRVRAANFPLIHALENSGFILVDGKIDFDLPMSRVKKTPLPSQVRSATKEDVEELKKIGMKIFVYNRLMNDPFIPRKKSNELYEKWIENSVKGEQADLVLVWEQQGKKILGFVTLKKKGYIPLVGVTEGQQGKGIGKKLVQAAFSKFKEWKVKTAKIDTQMTNIGSSRAFEGCGFRIIDSYLTFRWRAR